MYIFFVQERKSKNREQERKDKNRALDSKILHVFCCEYTWFASIFTAVDISSNHQYSISLGFTKKIISSVVSIERSIKNLDKPERFPISENSMKPSERKKVIFQFSLIIYSITLSLPIFALRSNCDEKIGVILRQHYQRPYFLPVTAESKKTDWIFMGSNGYGAPMHVGFKKLCDDILLNNNHIIFFDEKQCLLKLFIDMQNVF